MDRTMSCPGDALLEFITSKEVTISVPK